MNSSIVSSIRKSLASLGIARPSKKSKMDVVGPSSSSFSPCSSAFDNDLTFKKIMEYVGTDHGSLLQCRLVSHSWNEMALVVLRSLGTTLSLEQIEDENLTSSGPLLQKEAERYSYQSNSDGDVNGLLKSALGQLGVKLELNSNRPEEETTTIFNAIRTVSVAGRWTITSITYNVAVMDAPAGDPNFREFVKICASTLKHLTYMNLSKLQTTTTTTTGSPNLIEEFGPLEFPNLTNICIHLLPSTSADGGSNPWAIPLLMANSAPHLRVMQVLRDFHYRWPLFGREPDRENLSQFRCLLSPSTRTKIQELELPISKWDWDFRLPDYAEDLHFPSVKKLKLQFQDVAAKTILENENLFINFLRKSFPSLQELVLNWVGAAKLALDQTDDPPPNQNYFGFGALHLQNLVHLGITSSLRLSRASCVNLARLLHSMADRTTTVKILTMDFNSFCQVNALNFEFSNELPADQPLFTGIKFPSVSTLRLTGLSAPSLWFHRLEEHEISQVSTMIDSVFPNLEAISIDLGPLLRKIEDDHQLDIFEQCVLPGVLKTTRKVRRLEIKTYCRNWFGNPHMDLENSALAQGLEHLELNWSKNCWCDEPPEIITVPELESVIKRFPRLTSFRIEPELVCSSRIETTFDEVIEEVQALRGKFPGIDIMIY